MNQVIFADLKGQIIESSEHGNYLVIKLTNRISICATKTNIWNWQESPSGNFKSFITYIGFNSDSVQCKYLQLISEMGGYIRHGEDKRTKLRVQGKFIYEMKVRNLNVDNLLDLLTII